MENQGEMFSDLALEKQYDNMIKELDMENKETAEEVAKNSLYSTEHLNESERIIFTQGCVYGAHLQAKRMYVEADKIMKFLDTEVELKLSDTKTIVRIKWYFETFFEQFKKK